MALALELRSAQRRLGEAVTRARGVLSAAADELQVAVDELRELAHGIHPGILMQGGLAARSSRWPTRTPLPVSRRRDPGAVSA